MKLTGITMSEKKEVDECPSEEASSQAESFDASKSGTSETYDMKDFCPGIRIEAKDFDGKWYPAKVSDVDWTENEILVHFENWNTKFDEWIPMDSSRLRPIQKPVLQQKDVIKFSKGEEVMAIWAANQKYPGIIQAVLANDRYDVLFSDGFLKRLKAHKISKLQGGTIKPEIKTFADIGTKEERRERKRKINVAELFHINKRSKKKGLVSSKSKEIKTYPVTKSRTKSSLIKKFESFEDNTEGIMNAEIKDVKISDEKSLIPSTSTASRALVDNIPAAFEVKYLNGQTETWSKQLYQRSEGRTAGKLDIVILNPQGRKFRSRNEIMKYCEENGIVYSHEAFDFSAKGRPKSKPLLQTSSVKYELNVEDKEKSVRKGSRKTQSDLLVGPQNLGGVFLHNEVLTPENITPNKVFIGDYEVVIENGKFICPVKVCGKHFRRENLLHMHMKHYHPEFSKYLDYTPSVTDLAYARTVGNLDAVEIPPVTQRKVSGSEKLEKSTIRVESFRRTSDISADSSKEAKKLKISDNRLEGKIHSMKLLPDNPPTLMASAEEPIDDSQNKISTIGLPLGKCVSNLSEGESVMQENSSTLVNGVSVEQTPQNSESNMTSSITKPSRHPRLHSRKKCSRFQGPFSEHIRKRRFISQDRSRLPSRIGRQQQLQQPGQQFPPTQPLQTTIPPQPCVEDTNSNTQSQGHTLARYLKPHLNISNEISGKNTLLTNYKTLSPGSEGTEERSKVNTFDESIKIWRKNQTIYNRRSFLAGLINAHKRKGKGVRKRLRKRRKKKERLTGYAQSSEADRTLKEIESGPNENTEKPDAFGGKKCNYSCSIVDSLRTNENSPILCSNKTLKLKLRRFNDSIQPKYENSEADLQDKFLNTHSDSSETNKEPNVNAETKLGEDISNNCVEVLKSSLRDDEKSFSEMKSKSEINSKDLPGAFVLLENVCRKENNSRGKITSQKGNENVRNCPFNETISPRISRRRGEKRKRNKLLTRGQCSMQLAAKKVRFENTILEKWIDEGEAFDCGKHDPKNWETIRREERKSKQRKFLSNEYFNENNVNQHKRLDDSSRAEKCILNKKTRSLDQAEATEDSKSPAVIENDKVEKLRRNEIINCLCGIIEEDGLMIQCDICLCWQHGHCAGILKELDVPDKYTCAICKNPFRGRSSMKYLHDQEWLKEGTLPSLTFRSKRNDIIDQRKTILKRSHDLSGSITLLAQVIHSLRIKVNIAEKKDHPKLWLWAKKWTEKKPNRLKEESDIKEERSEEQNMELGNEIKKEGCSQDEKHLPKAPEPEAPIDSAECRLNLLDHLIHYQSLIDDRLSCIESLVAELESMQDDAVNDETPDRYPRTKATVQMILRDLNTMKKIATI